MLYFWVERYRLKWTAFLGEMAMTLSVGFSLEFSAGVAGSVHWYNEIHPDTEGFRKISKRFRKAILLAVPLGG
jgi:hypothetical protein